MKRVAIENAHKLLRQRDEIGEWIIGLVDSQEIGLRHDSTYNEISISAEAAPATIAEFRRAAMADLARIEADLIALGVELDLTGEAYVASLSDNDDAEDEEAAA